MNYLLLIILAFSVVLPPMTQANPAESSTVTLQNRKFHAAIFNAAVGDALGRITEFVDTIQDIYQQFGPQGVTQLSQATIKHPTSQKIIAPYTDDTVMSLIVLETMLHGKKQQSNSDDLLNQLAHSFAKLFSNKKYIIDPLFDIRAHGIRNIKAGIALNQLIEHNQDTTVGWWHNKPQQDVAAEAGCGSAMRAWPIGLVFPDNILLVIKLADEQSKITHRHPMARAASAAMAVGIAYAYNDESVDETIEAMIAAATTFDEEELLYKVNAQKLSTTQQPTKNMIAQDKLLTSDMIRYAYNAARAGKTPYEVLGTHNSKQNNYRSPNGFLLGWAADEAIAACVYLFVRYHDNPQLAIIEGVNTPGDSDSIASLAGALIGAKTGILFHDAHPELLENYDYLTALELL